MAPTTEKTGQITVILPEGTRYLPLGTKIRKLDYQMPDGWQKEEVLRFLDTVKEDLREDNLSIVPYFYEILGLSTANLEDFKKISSRLWSEFKETVNLIANHLLAEKDGRRQAADFLRPLAYREIPQDPDHVWGYPIQTVNPLRIPDHRPSRCSWRYLNEDAGHILAELQDELSESFERRESPGSLPAQDQCSEPHQPMRYRLETEIEGPSEVEEGGLITLAPLETSQVEYGKNYLKGESLPTEREWDIDEYTCSEPPTVINTNENQFVLQIPKILHQDCRAVLSLTTRGPFGTPVVAHHTVEILNKENEAPTVQIQESREGVLVKLKAKAKDPNGDSLTYHWKQIGGKPVILNGRSDGPALEFFSPSVFDDKAQTVVFKLTVTDQPRGKKVDGPKTVEVVHRMGFRESIPIFERTPEQIATDKKRKGVLKIAKKTGGKPRVATSVTLKDKIQEAIVPPSMVDFIDLMFVIDASGSMADDIKKVKARVPEFLEAMKQKVIGQDLSRIRIGIASYVDDKQITHLNLTPANQAKLSARLGEVVERIRTAHGSLETVWDALYVTIANENWNQAPKGFRKLVYLTDEPGDPGKLGKKEGDVTAIATANHVAVEPIFFEMEFAGLLGSHKYGYSIFEDLINDEKYKKILFQEQFNLFLKDTINKKIIFQNENKPFKYLNSIENIDLFRKQKP